MTIRYYDHWDGDEYRSGDGNFWGSMPPPVSYDDYSVQESAALSFYTETPEVTKMHVD